MDAQENGYRTSFFKPVTEMARLNRNMVIVLVCIWTVAIFGFQIALKVLEKPTPEPAYTEFQQVWAHIRGGNASPAEQQVFARVSLSVLGKNFIDPEYRKALDNGLSHSLYHLAGTEQGALLKEKIAEFEVLKARIENITNPEYVKAKNQLASEAAPILGLSAMDIRTSLVPVELSASMMDVLSPESRDAIPVAMSLYLIHNQSFLTDTKILGFPFHYFYTAVFLLVLFVGLCWLYCVRADRRDRQLGLAE